MQSVRDQVESALLRELTNEWVVFNRTLFSHRMRPAVIELGDGLEQAGRWEPSSRTIRLSRRLVHGQSWGMVLEVLKHEMAHQFTTEALRVTTEAPHGPTFKAVCARLGIDGTPSGIPQGDGTEPRMVRRIRRLLALADSPNEHEAQAAMNAAHKLMLKHNIALVEAQQRSQYGFRQIGPVKKARQSWEKVLGGILSEHFFVRVVWAWAYDPKRAQRGRVLEVMGTTDNLDISEWVHAFLIDTAERLWRDHKLAQGIRGNRERRRFLAGVMTGFSDKLEQQADACRESGLIWVGDGDLDAYTGHRYPRLSRGRATTMTVSNAWFAGRAAGKQIVLNKPVSQDSTQRQRSLAGPVAK